MDELLGVVREGLGFSIVYLGSPSQTLCGNPHRLPTSQCEYQADAQCCYTECQNAIYGRRLECETILLMALVCEQVLADTVEKILCQDIA